jgi:hypothetical protein
MDAVLYVVDPQMNMRLVIVVDWLSRRNAMISLKRDCALPAVSQLTRTGRDTIFVGNAL